MTQKVNGIIPKGLVIADSLGFISKCDPETWHHKFVHHGEDDSCTEVAGYISTKSGVWRWVRLTRASPCHILGHFIDLLTDVTLLSTDRGQCCLIFGVLVETELTDWFTKESIHMGDDSADRGTS